MNQPQITIEQVENTLDRFANIGVGMCWSMHMSYNKAAETVNIATIMLLMHLGVARTLQADRAIKGSLEKAMKVYYALNQHARDVPTRNAILEFKQN